MKGSQGVNGMAAKPALGLSELLRRMVRAIKRAFVKPPSESWDDGDAVPQPRPFGLRFRERR